MQNTCDLGTILKTWRSRRRMSQLDLALEAEISSRHLSFIETGRSRPTRSMVLRIAERLDVPLRERNTMLLAAGYSPEYAEQSRDTASLQAEERLVGLIEQMSPNPALIIDGGWNLIAANAAARLLMTGVAPNLLDAPVNVVRLSLDPQGLAPSIANLGEWRAHLVERLERQLRQTGDARIATLLDEIRSRSADPAEAALAAPTPVIPLILQKDGQRLCFFSTTMVVGGPRDVVLSELAVEMFLPSDPQTRAWLERKLSHA